MSDKKNYKRGYCVFPETGQDVHDWEKEQSDKKTQTMNWTNDEENRNSAKLVYIKNEPVFSLNLKEWERQSKINKIIYEVGDECVFEITKGDKKWTISLDDFFDKVIQICGEKKDD